MLCLLGAVGAGYAAEAGVAVRGVQEWGNVFGGRKAVFHYFVTAPQPFTGVAAWEWSIGGRVAARGERQIAAAPGGGQPFEVAVEVPPVKEGVRVAAELRVTVAREPGGPVVADDTRRLTVFGEDAFANQRQWLTGLRIGLFDPEGNSAEALTAAKVPFQAVQRLAEIDEYARGERKGGILVVGEGLSLTTHRSLADALMAGAAKGARVLVLAPQDGAIPLPAGTDNGLPTPSRVTFAGRDIIAELDKQFDATAWPPDGNIIASTFSLESQRSGTVAAFTNSAAGWPWLAIEYPSGGRLLVIGFPLVAKWEATPTPRFLFARLLHWLAEN